MNHAASTAPSNASLTATADSFRPLHGALTDSSCSLGLGGLTHSFPSNIDSPCFDYFLDSFWPYFEICLHIDLGFVRGRIDRRLDPKLLVANY